MGSVDLESKFQGLSCQDLLKHGPKWSPAETVVSSAQGTTHPPLVTSLLGTIFLLMQQRSC